MQHPRSVRRIVVGIDGSEHSRTALRWAIHEAAEDDSEIDAVFVYDPGTAWFDPDLDAEATFIARSSERAEGALRDVLSGLEAAEELTTPITPVVIPGEPAFALVDVAQDADLLVVGTRGRGGFRGLFLGSVSQRCAQFSACPVVIVPASDQITELRTGPRHILVGVDGSPQAVAALKWSVEEASRCGGAIDAVYAFDRGLAWIVADEDTEPWITQYSARQADRILQESLAAVDVPTEVVVAPRAKAGPPGPTLIELAKHADLLVVGRRGRGGVAGLLLGSVSQRCSERSSCPVVIVPTSGTPDLECEAR